MDQVAWAGDRWVPEPMRGGEEEVRVERGFGDRCSLGFDASHRSDRVVMVNDLGHWGNCHLPLTRVDGGLIGRDR